MLKYLEEIIDDNKEDNNANEVENTDKKENTNNNNIHNNNNVSVSEYPVKQFHLLINTYHYLNLIHIKYQPQMNY